MDFVLKKKEACASRYVVYDVEWCRESTIYVRTLSDIVVLDFTYPIRVLKTLPQTLLTHSLHYQSPILVDLFIQTWRSNQFQVRNMKLS
jgi:hypothetical protein